ncbi:MAG: response regulator [Saprospiraceae bacterium]
MNYRAVLVDDEPKLREVLSIKLANHCPQVQVIGQAGNAHDGAHLISTLKPDLVFLDIAMPGGSGLDLLTGFPDPAFEVIFVTGHDSYVLDALRLSAADYLLKPVLDKELISGVERAVERLQKRPGGPFDASLLRHNLEVEDAQMARVVIPGSEEYQFLEITRIVRCEGWQKYTRIYLDDNDVLVSSYPIGHFRKLLEPFGIFQTHKSHLVNPVHILTYRPSGVVRMKDGGEVPVARRRRDDFQARYLSGPGF